MKLRMAQYTSLLLLVLVTGVFWGTWFSLSRSIASITSGTFLEIGKTMIHNLAWPMRILFPAALLSTLLMLVGLFRERRGPGPGPAFYLALCGLLLFVAALLVTLLVNVPIDNQLIHWEVSTLPPNWEDVRDRWQFYHTIRTFAALGGLALVLAGTFVANRRVSAEPSG
jgi:uncharacterized membrane protein